MIINIVVLYSARKAINLKKIWILLFAGIITMPLGTHLLVIMNENLLKIFIGLMIFVFGDINKVIRGTARIENPKPVRP